MYSVCILLKVVGYYDFSVLSMSLMGFQNKCLDGGGWVGGVSSIQVFLGDFWNFVNFAKPLSIAYVVDLSASFRPSVSYSSQAPLQILFNHLIISW